MDIREKFKRLVIERIYGEPYKEFIKKMKSICPHCKSELDKIEKYWCHCDTCCKEFLLEEKHIYTKFQITLTKVLQAFKNRKDSFSISYSVDSTMIIEDTLLQTHIRWHLMQDGEELTDDDQSNKAIKALYKILK